MNSMYFKALQACKVPLAGLTASRQLPVNLRAVVNTPSLRPFSSSLSSFTGSSSTTSESTSSSGAGVGGNGGMGSGNFWLYLTLTGAAVGGAAYWWSSTTSQKEEGKEGQKKGSLGLTPLDKKDLAIVFVLGGPGAGKGTQCANIVKDYGFVHLSAGDLLREERMRPGSPYGDLINTYIREGQIVPMEITISLLHAAMASAPGSRFLIDGFPRKMDQALAFEQEIASAKMVLYFECPEAEMLKRLVKRGETSGRVDDNVESIKKRFVTFRDTSYPVIEHYKDKVKTVTCMNTPENVYKETRKVFDELLK